QLRGYERILRGKIIPKLNQLTEEDSILFDKVIAARIARNEERDFALKEAKAKIADKELRKATELPLEIARYSYNVGR
ncbi:hypothetical protein ABTK35_20480, partial [Acinetobacter baumannii]